MKLRLEQLFHLLEIKLRSASGALVDELEALLGRCRKASRTLERLMAVASERRDQLQAAEMVKQCLVEVERSEAELGKANQAEPGEAWAMESSDGDS